MIDDAASGPAPATERALLEIRGLHAFYGESHVLHGVDISIAEGEIVTLLGRNGAGKTTTLRAIMGIIGACTGSIQLRGAELIGLAAYRIARRGIGYVPEERGIFASLDVEENLRLPLVVRSGGFSMEDIYGLFPNLKARRRRANGGWPLIWVFDQNV
jgi:branched-chain amino acid transport system ATP-binding protein